MHIYYMLAVNERQLTVLESAARLAYKTSLMVCG